VVCGFGVFVCVACSGAQYVFLTRGMAPYDLIDNPVKFQFIINWYHVYCSREFGHRVKGISLCSFSEEELNTLEAWGNKVRGLFLKLKLP